MNCLRISKKIVTMGSDAITKLAKSPVQLVASLLWKVINPTGIVFRTSDSRNTNAKRNSFHTHND